MIEIQKLANEPKDFNTMVSRKNGTLPFLVKGVVINKKSGKAYNIDIHMDTEKMTAQSKVKVACSCDDFKYRWAYTLHQKGSLLNPKSFVLEPPKITNPDGNVNACKHIHTFIKTELSKTLKSFSTRKNKL